jgi:hypothetical protein
MGGYSERATLAVSLPGDFFCYLKSLVHAFCLTMSESDSSNQPEVFRRTSDYKPPRSPRHWLIGRPLLTADAPHQTIGKAVGLAVFASDALSSTAYATQEILGVLAAAGTIAFG